MPDITFLKKNFEMRILFSIVTVFCLQNTFLYAQSDTILVNNVIKALTSKDTLSMIYHIKYYEQKEAVIPEDSYQLVYFKAPHNFFYRERSNTLIIENNLSVIIDDDGQSVYLNNSVDNNESNKYYLWQENLFQIATVSIVVLEDSIKLILFSITNEDYKKLNIYFSHVDYMPTKIEAEFYPQYNYDERILKVIYPKMVVDIETFDYLLYEKMSLENLEIKDVISNDGNNFNLTQQYSSYDFFNLSE